MKSSQGKIGRSSDNASHVSKGTPAYRPPARGTSVVSPGTLNAVGGAMSAAAGGSVNGTGGKQGGMNAGTPGDRAAHHVPAPKGMKGK